MAIKTFTTGEVLTAADTNTYLSNAGLVYVTSGSLSSTSTDFTGCFTSTYDNYRIILSNVSLSGVGDIYFRMLLGSTPDLTANYNWAFTGITENAASTNSNFSGSTQGYTGITASNAAPALASSSLDCINPAVAQRTLFTINALLYSGAFGTRNGMCIYNVASAFNGIQFRTSAAVTMTGTVTIYGYRKP